MSPVITDAAHVRQASLFDQGPPRVDAAFAGLCRTWLDATSWVDRCAGWLHGADEVFDALVDRLPWRQREVVMFDRKLPEPRLTAWWGDDGATAEPLDVLAA